MKGKVSLHERHVRVLEPCFFVKSISIADVSNAESLEDAKRSEDSFFHSKKVFLANDEDPRRCRSCSSKGRKIIQ